MENKGKILGPQRVGSSDQFQTPPEGLNILLPFINKEWDIWECAWGKGNLYNQLKQEGYNVIGSDEDFDFLTNYKECDCIITNPPYSIKDKFIERCYELGKPFALLMPLTALEGKKRQKCYKEHGLQLIIPNKRINFETPSGNGTGSWFCTAWYTWGLNLPKDILFVDLC